MIKTKPCQAHTGACSVSEAAGKVSRCRAALLGTWWVGGCAVSLEGMDGLDGMYGDGGCGCGWIEMDGDEGD